MRSASWFLISCLVLAPAVASMQEAPLRSVEVTPDQLTWTVSPNGTSQAVLYGDPTKAGLYIIQVKFPAGLKLQPHFHPEDRIVTVLSGTAHFGLGDVFDESKLKTLPVGSMWTEPANVHHFAYSKDGAVRLQIVGHGPTGTSAVSRDPADGAPVVPARGRAR